MPSSNSNLLVVDAEEFLRRIGKVIDDKLDAKLKEFGESLASDELVQNQWFSAIDFCKKYRISRTSLFRYAKDGKVEVCEFSKQNKKFRWKE